MVEYGGGGVLTDRIAARAAAAPGRWRSGVQFLVVFGDFVTISSSERGKWSYSNSSEVRLLRFNFIGDLGSGAAASKDELPRVCPSSSFTVGSVLVSSGTNRLFDLVFDLVRLLASGESVRVLVGGRARKVAEVCPR